MEKSWLTDADHTILDQFFLLQNVSPTLIATILADTRCRSAVYEKGQALSAPGYVDNCLGLILSGRIEVRQQAAERDLILRFLGTGDVFGAAAVFAKESVHVTHLTALVKTRVLCFPQNLLSELMRQDFAAAENYMAFLTGRIQFLNHRIQSLISGSAEQLLRNFLVRESAGADMVILDSSISDLARRLNISRASLYRAFDALEQGGHIKKTGKKIAILNWNGLQL
ncbi:MAG: Crp/Fnr family transcriptional regulator [Oscillospiraceae bacterium]|nr:Crp/Fnr family transcriptional regulator [Oscillospiraceae bacterium]